MKMMLIVLDDIDEHGELVVLFGKNAFLHEAKS